MEATMPNSDVEVFFNHIPRQYNCGDIRALLDEQLEQAGPLLTCTVNGIDLIGGMMLGFATGSRARSMSPCSGTCP